MPLLPASALHLPEICYERRSPDPVPEPRFLIWNASLAQELGLEPDLQLYAGNRVPEPLQPLAMAYAGHQFGHFTMLGDGRAVLLGEAENGVGARFEVQLKGSGRTRYSRGGDGRAAVEPMLREHLISEAMHALGIPTTRSLCVVATGAPVIREQVLPGALLTRVASSHLRVGSFEFAAAYADDPVLESLLRFAIQRHDTDADHALAFFRGVLERQAALVAKWMAVGFVHGVMNTDNMAVSGETIDYGPCAFMDRYDPETVFSSIDVQGRYAYANQPRIAHWNLSVLASALLSLMEEEKARTELDRFAEVFRNCWQQEMNRKLGMAKVLPGDDTLVGELLELMFQNKADYTRTFLDLNPQSAAPGFEAWHDRWQERIQAEEISSETAVARMQLVNPVVIPRNHQVEAALNAAGDGNLKPYENLLSMLRDPFNREKEYGELAYPPAEDAPKYVTFCGT